jgi:cation diffusion facilitator CzcD-associated flavoprotein CzcO
MSTRTHVAVVGAGIGGVALGIGLLEDGVDDFLILERSDGVGGTWRHNTYPGAACDVPSHLYSYSFAPNPFWSRAFAGQAEILDYVERCADDGGIRPHLRTGWSVATAVWSDDQATWTLRSTHGEEVVADVVVFATGLFSEPRRPDIAGVDSFAGDVLHSARWDHSVALRGRRVGVIGTGASGTQIVPAIADDAAGVTVFQRTPPYVLPRKDPFFTADEHDRFASDPAELARVRQELYDAFEGITPFRLGDPSAAAIKEIALGHLAHRVPDDELRAKLTPDYEMGCNRTIISSDWYKVLQRDDVELVTEGIDRIVPDGVVTVDGRTHELDVLVLATGFHVGEWLHGIEVVGRERRRLHDEWADRARAYLGMAVTGFPNLFVFYGPNTNQGGNSIILVLEAQAAYVRDAVRAMAREGVAVMEVSAAALERYDDELQEALAGTIWATGCRSYFVDAQGRIVTQMPMTTSTYAARTAQVDLEDFDLS